MVAPDATLGMDKVRVDKKRLLNVLQENQKKHQDEVKEVTKKWLKNIAIELKIQSSKVAENIDGANSKLELDFLEKFPRPKDYSDQYEKAIKKLEYSIDEAVYLTDREFDQYISDEWNWKSFHMRTMNSNSRI